MIHEEHNGHQAPIKEKKKEDNDLYLFLGLLVIALFTASISANVWLFRENKVLAEQVEQKHDTIMGLSKLYLLKK
jgi:hypothetical protein